MKKKHRYLTLATALLLGTGIFAQDRTETGYHKHDGFYLNLMGGGGSLNFSESSGNTKLTMGGAAGHFGLKLGGAITSNLILFGAVDSFVAFNPSATLTVGSSSGSGTLSNYTYSANMFGAGMAYYTDSNFYISTTLGYAGGTLSYSSGSTSASSSLTGGFGANLNLGVEWWVSSNWGLGAALVGHYSSVTDGSIPATQLYLGLAVTATYN